MNQTEGLSDKDIVKVQLVRYILDTLGERCDQLKLVKLIALADIYKLRLDGETITGDTYVALKNGPAPSAISNIISFNSNWVDDTVLKYAGEYIETYNTEVSATEKKMEHDYLSDFDKQCADDVIKKYGHLSADDLIDGNNGENVHAFEAWRKHAIPGHGVGQSALISLGDFFVNDGPVQVSGDVIERSKERYHHGDF